MTASIARKSVTVAEYSLPSGERRRERKRANKWGRGVKDGDGKQEKSGEVYQDENKVRKKKFAQSHPDMVLVVAWVNKHFRWLSSEK